MEEGTGIAVGTARQGSGVGQSYSVPIIPGLAITMTGKGFTGEDLHSHF